MPSNNSSRKLVKSKRTNKRNVQRPDNVVAISIPGPAQPPTIKPKAPVMRKHRAQVDVTAAVGYTGTKIATDFAIPSGVTTFWVHSVQCYCMASTTKNADISVTDSQSGRVFTDEAPIGNPPARVGMLFSKLTRITPQSTTGTTTIFQVGADGVDGVIDLTVEYIV